jgi:hypothetical protein
MYTIGLDKGEEEKEEEHGREEPPLFEDRGLRGDVK